MRANCPAFLGRQPALQPQLGLFNRLEYEFKQYIGYLYVVEDVHKNVAGSDERVMLWIQWYCHVQLLRASPLPESTPDLRVRLSQAVTVIVSPFAANATVSGNASTTYDSDGGVIMSTNDKQQISLAV